MGGTFTAITKILRRSARPEKLIAYATNPLKTDAGLLTASLNCSLNHAAHEMRQTREQFGKTAGTQMFHIIQSFSPGEITPQEALELAQAFAQEHLADYQVVIGTHQDHEHIHSHIIFNAVSFVDGKKYHSTPQNYYQQIRATSDRLCCERGLSIILDDGRIYKSTMSYAEWKAVQNGGISLRKVVERDVQEVLSYALDYGEFLQLMEGKGYEVRHGKYLSFRPYGYERFIRPKLGQIPCTEEAIRTRIEGALEDPTATLLVPKPFTPYPKPVMGIIGIYRHYLYLLGCIVKHRAPPHVSAYLKNELRKFENYKEQHRYLSLNHIITAEDLQQRESSLQARLDALIKTRTILNAQKKRKHKLYAALATVKHFSPVASLMSEGRVGTAEEREQLHQAQEMLAHEDIPSLKQEQAALYQCIADTNAEIRTLRSELRKCRTILSTVPQIQGHLRAVRVLDVYSIPKHAERVSNIVKESSLSK